MSTERSDAPTTSAPLVPPLTWGNRVSGHYPGKARPRRRAGQESTGRESTGRESTGAEIPVPAGRVRIGRAQTMTWSSPT